ncbi:hypothetical protein HHI36_021225 [Cryptolaemus montrouzieri]|uniref:SWIM-type domain-containing protein n=1 Tax=Cryptolaemus montrouzieri TaxID=559131 RepID=A0ABD2MWZ4_9CUCU
MDGNPSIIVPVAFDILRDAVDYYKINQGFTEDHLESLHDVFGNIFIGAAELLEHHKITQYRTDDGIRKVYKVGNKKEQFTIYENINFCHCPVFRYQVLELQNCVTCKHVLAMILGDALGKVSKETVTGSQMVDFLDEQLNYIVE